jgi:iron complex transport system ATP-binding protein
MTVSVVEAAGVSARYRDAPRPVLVDVSLSVAPGEILAILGPNGAGKSTLLRVLAGTLRPERGSVELRGAPLERQPRRDVARQVAFVAQTEEVRFAFSVRDVVLMGRAPHQGTSMRASREDVAAVEAALIECDLSELAERPVGELSVGERKRVAIARAYAQSAPLLLLDEPTASLDVRHQVTLFEQIRRRVQAGGACVVVTHDLQLAAAHATRVALFKGGRLVGAGSVDDVLTAPRLGEAFEWPIDTAVAVVGSSKSRVFVPRGRA